MNGVLIVAKAFEFATKVHANQRRKGLRAEPYVNHLAEVARLLAEATGGEDPILVAAGLLHDTVEDTDTTPEELEAEFGAEVAGIVREVTDDKSLPRGERKELQVQSAPGKSLRARMVKVADKTSNLRSILDSPPAAWGRERKTEYFAWSRRVVEACGAVNPYLEERFREAHARGTAALR
jgi:GTP diphosphokinase / guanosine-3',5'-bis(diphosphate) 3'-diphosphatase